MAHCFNMLVNGRPEAGPTSFDVINPATGQAFARCPRADMSLVNEAVAAAKAAFPAWAATPIDERATLVAKLADALEARVEEFARLLTAEQGKPLNQAIYEVMGGVFTLRAFVDMRLEQRVCVRTARPKSLSTVRRSAWLQRSHLGIFRSSFS